MRPHFLELSGKSGICIAFFFFSENLEGKLGSFSLFRVAVNRGGLML